MKNKKKLLLILLLAISVMCFFTFTLGKYVYNSAWNYYLKSKSFYFSSTNLSDVVQNTSNFQWSGEDIVFDLKNYLNDGLITNYDISYSVSCTIEGEAASYTYCNLNNTNTNTYSGVLSGYQNCINEQSDGVNVSAMSKNECEISGYTWRGEKADVNLSFNVVLTDQTKVIGDIVVNVVATSTSPYSKTISGKYILKKNQTSIQSNEIIYKNNNNDDNLIITNYTMNNKCYSVQWEDSNILLDTTDLIVENTTIVNNYIKGIEILIPSLSYKKLTFYNLNNSVLTLSDYDIDEIEC